MMFAYIIMQDLFAWHQSMRTIVIVLYKKIRVASVTGSVIQRVPMHIITPIPYKEVGVASSNIRHAGNAARLVNYDYYVRHAGNDGHW